MQCAHTFEIEDTTEDFIGVQMTDWHALICECRY